MWMEWSRAVHVYSTVQYMYQYSTVHVYSTVHYMYTLQYSTVHVCSTVQYMYTSHLSLVSYSVNMTATWVLFRKTTKNPLNSPHAWSPSDSYRQNLTKIKSKSSHITHHTSHITYCMGIFKFNKITSFILKVIFWNSYKLIQNNFSRCSFLKIIIFTMQTQRSCPKFGKQPVSNWRKSFLKKKSFCGKILK